MSVSKAFQKMHVARKPKTAFEAVGSYLDMGFKMIIPDAVKDMPPRGMYFVGILGNLAALLFFCLLVLLTYNSNMKTVFLSPSEDAGICSPELRPVTGNFLADANGLWQSSTKFSTSSALYDFTCQTMRVNNSQWASMVVDLENSLTLLGESQKNYSLAENLLVWTSWGGGINTGDMLQFFTMYSDVGVVFNREYVHGVISNVNADCNASAVSSFDASTYILSLEYSNDEFTSNPGCYQTINPQQLGYDPIFDGDEFTMSFDVRSLVTALAVNTGLIDLDMLRPVVGSSFVYEYLGKEYSIAKFYDPRYQGSQLCV